MRALLRLLPVLVAMSWIPVAAEPAPVRIAIIIDDLGNNLVLGRQAVDLPGAVTYALLPQRPHSAELAHRAHRIGKEVMLHLPMQTTDGKALGPGGLYADMDRAEFARTIAVNLHAIPHVAGVNNHMGSLLTRHHQAMRWLMEELRCRGNLYFVDSRTDVYTVARSMARAAGLRHARRDVFLDNEPTPAQVHRQLGRLIDHARRKGTAIGIGHPHPVTLAVLAKELPGLAGRGIQLVPVSGLVQADRSEDLWHVYSSPLPQVAKNSKR